MNIKEIKELLEEQNPDALFCDGLDEALIGISHQATKLPVAAYSYDKCIATFVAQGMTEEDAVEYFAFNTLGAWVGENTPVFVWMPL